MKEILVRLIYVEILGHDASLGYVLTAQQTATQDLPQKRAGYLACALMLSPDHEFRFMLVNQMQRDLASANILECCAALVAVCKLVTTEMIPALLPRVQDLLVHDQTMVRKKAVMALHRFYQMDPPSISHLRDQVKGLLRDRDPAVMGAALCLLHEYARSEPQSVSDLVDQLVSILKQITEHRLPRDFDYHRMPAPWIQIKLLQVLATLGSNDKRASENMYEVLGECMRRADTGTNVGYAVVYEAVKTVTSIWPDTVLLDAAANAISRFLTSDAYNLKYLGVTGLAAIVREHPRYAIQHQLAVIDCLEDPDETLKRKTLELLFKMTNPANAEAVVDKLLHFLETAVDPFLRSDLVSRITQLADRYAPNNLWYVETMTRVFAVAGDLVDHDSEQGVLRLLSEGAEQQNDDEEQDYQADYENKQMRRRACVLFLDSLKRPQATEVVMRCAFWTLGEYAFLLSSKLDKRAKVRSAVPEDDVLRVESDDEEGEEDDVKDVPVVGLDEVVSVVCNAIDRTNIASSATRAYGISAVTKMCAQLARVPPRARQMFEKYSAARETELQQRCVEFLMICEDPTKTSALFPVDASCEDFEHVDFSFLNEFVDILRAAGAPEYQEALKVKNDFEYDEGMSLLGNGNGSDSAAAPAATNKLRFDAYDAPKMYENTISTSVSAENQAALSVADLDDFSKLMASTGLGGGNTTATPMNTSGSAAKPAKAVWGPKGYMGNLASTLGGGAQVSSTPPSSGSGGLTTGVAATTSQTMDYDAVLSMGALSSPGFNNTPPSPYEEKATMDDFQPPPPPPLPKKPEMTKKEKAAAALFGGITPSKSSSSSKTTPRASPPTSITSEPSTKKAPLPPPANNIMSSMMDADLLGVDSSPSFSSGYPPSTPAKSQDLMDFFSTPSAAPMAPTTTASFLPPMVSSLPPPSQLTFRLEPRAMSTSQFGQFWPSHAAEARASARANPRGFTEFLKDFASKLGVQLVEFIPSTQEAIFAGASGAETVLIHTKDQAGTAVDMMIRSKIPALTERVAEACNKA